MTTVGYALYTDDWCETQLTVETERDDDRTTYLIRVMDLRNSSSKSFHLTVQELRNLRDVLDGLITEAMR